MATSCWRSTRLPPDREARGAPVSSCKTMPTIRGWRPRYLAQITTNLARAGEPTHLLIETSTTEGQSSGLLHDSLVSCNNLITVELTRVHKVIGRLPAATMQKIDDCLKAALGLR